MQKSPVQHHCAFGILCYLLFYFFLFTPETGWKHSNHGGWAVTPRKCQQNTNFQQKGMFPQEFLRRSRYLLCEKTSRATEGATSRGSQARSFWISCWAPLVKDRKDSCRHTNDQLQHINPELLLLCNCWWHRHFTSNGDNQFCLQRTSCLTQTWNRNLNVRH